MTINICKNEGILGSLSLTPGSKLSAGNEQVLYTINVSSAVEEDVLLDGEFKIQSEDIKTGDFFFNFNQSQKDRYKIQEFEDGFSFSFTSRIDEIQFTINAQDFANSYVAELIVDARSSGYGSVNAVLEIRPEVQITQQTQQIIIELDEKQKQDVLTEKALKDISENKAFLSNKISLINEYNFYLENYEKSNLEETQLLNINLNHSSINIINYFKKQPHPINYSNFILHTNDYMKSEYPLLDKQKFLFPMYIEFKFETDNRKAMLTSYLNKIGMLEYFCYYYITKNKIQNINFNNLKNEILNTSIVRTNNIKKQFTGTINKITNFMNKSFQKTILIKLLEKQIEKVPEILSNEILMYRLDKLKNNKLLNSQYFINNFDNIELICFDTQLKYDTEYEYKIFKIETDLNGVITEKEITEYTTKTKIIDSPPLPPDVSYIPFKGVDKQILINLNGNVGRYSDYPIIIKDSDVDIFNKILNNSVYSRNVFNENKIQFEADDANTEYEILRLESAPKSYKDFSNAYQVKIKDTSFLDDIKPNIKYYYIARSIDVHGNISNPTNPIELQLINESGTIYLLKKEYTFGEEAKLISKNFANLIKIKPSKQQLEINPSLSYDSKPTATSAKEINLFLGNKDISVWNKPFLMRITSKMTGKKIDIKFKFTYSQPK